MFFDLLISLVIYAFSRRVMTIGMSVWYMNQALKYFHSWSGLVSLIYVGRCQR